MAGSADEHLAAHLENGPPLTPQRRAILRVLAEAPGFLSAQALHDRLPADEHRGTASLTTVYRSLHALAATGHLHVIRDQAGRQLFRLQPSRQPGHYLICPLCSASVLIDAGPVEEWATRIAEKHGFTEIRVIAELVGQCPTCTPSMPD